MTLGRKDKVLLIGAAAVLLAAILLDGTPVGNAIGAVGAVALAAGAMVCIGVLATEAIRHLRGKQ